LAIDAHVTIRNPLAEEPSLAALDLNVDIPWRIPFGVYLPLRDSFSSAGSPDSRDDEDALLARSFVPPFRYSSKEAYLNISLKGTVEQLDSSDPSSPLARGLSRFLSRFLDSRSNVVVVRALDGPSLPRFLSSLMSQTRFPLAFPGTRDRHQLLTDVRIEEMKVAPGVNGDLLCSGTIVGKVDLPREMRGLGSSLDVTQILPDVLVYDGRPDEEDSEGRGVYGYPPQPLPENAFARMRPAEALVANTTREFDKERNETVSVVRARIESVPLEVLESRGAVFRRSAGPIFC
jgi:hypothetical protein